MGFMAKRDKVSNCFRFSQVASTFDIDKVAVLKTPLLRRNKKLGQRFESLFDVKKKYLEIDRSRNSEPHEYNFVDVFSGAGGLSQGFLQAGFLKLLSVEIDSDASSSLRRNFPSSHHHEGPIEQFSDAMLEALRQRHKRIHVLCGGPPCQGFSVAGARDPADPRNFLFKQFVRFARILKPDYVMLENVPGILSMQNGTVQAVIRQSFAEIGYPDMSVALLESAEYGVPQLRQRAIFIANRHEGMNPYPKPIFADHQFVPIESCIMDLADMPPDPSINHEWTRHSSATERRIAEVPPGGSLYTTYYDAFKRQYPGKPSMTVKENHGGTHIHPHRNRVLSARELARLQTFPDSYIFSGTMKRAMWQIGNAVPPLLAEYIARALKVALDEMNWRTSENDVMPVLRDN